MATPTEQDVFLAKRISLLSGSDWTQLPDSPLSSTKKAEWATYRQSLRDLEVTSDFPTEPTD